MISGWQKRQTMRRSLETLVEAVLWSAPSLWFQSHVLRTVRLLIGSARSEASKCTERIVLIKPDRIGDFVLSTPLLRELRRSRPDAWITLVTSSGAYELARHCPYVNSVLVAPQPRRGVRTAIAGWRATVTFAWAHLLPLHATTVVLARRDVDLYRGFALLAFTCACRRIGFTTAVTPEKACRNRGSDFLLTHVVPDTPARHDVEKNLALARALKIEVLSNRTELWLAHCREPQVSGRLLQQRFVALCPFSTEAAKDWPLSRFVEVVRRFPSVPFVLLAGADHLAAANTQDVRATANLISLAGQLALDESASLLARSGAVLTVDTGLMHIAGALGRPLVVVHHWPEGADPDSHYSPERFGPWQASAEILRPDAGATGNRPIDTVSIDRVVRALEKHLGTC